MNDRRTLELSKIDEKQMQERIERNMAERGKKMRTLNTNVSLDIQQLFDYMSRSTSVSFEWNDTSIVNSKYGLAIHPPYTSVIGDHACTHYSWIEQQLNLFWNEKQKKNKNVNNVKNNVKDKNSVQSSAMVNNQNLSIIQNLSQAQQQMLMRQMNVQQFQQQMQSPVVNSQILNYQNTMNKSSGLQSNQNVIRGGRGHSRGRGRGYNDKPHVPPRHQYYGQYHSRGRIRGRGGRNRGGKGRMFGGKGGRNNNSRVNSNSNGKPSGMNSTQVQSNLQSRNGGERFNE